MSQWEDVLKGQAKEASEGASKLRADRLSQEKKLRERSEGVEAEEQRVGEVRAELEEREKALVGREAELAELEAGREARAAELEGVRDRLALLEKGLEGQRADLARRKVGDHTTKTEELQMIAIRAWLGFPLRLTGGRTVVHVPLLSCLRSGMAGVSGSDMPGASVEVDSVGAV